MALLNLDKLRKIEMGDGISMRVVTAETVTVAHVEIAAGAIVPEHAHHHEQVTSVVEGELELTVDGVPHRLMPGRVMVLSPNVPHSAKGIKDCKIIDVFPPVREDLR